MEPSKMLLLRLLSRILGRHSEQGCEVSRYTYWQNREALNLAGNVAFVILGRLFCTLYHPSHCTNTINHFHSSKHNKLSIDDDSIRLASLQSPINSIIENEFHILIRLTASKIVTHSFVRGQLGGQTTEEDTRVSQEGDTHSLHKYIPLYNFRFLSFEGDSL